MIKVAAAARQPAGDHAARRGLRRPHRRRRAGLAGHRDDRAEEKIDGLLDVLRPYGVLEMVRTGRVAMARGQGSGTARAGVGAAAALPEAEGVSYSV